MDLAENAAEVAEKLWNVEVESEEVEWLREEAGEEVEWEREELAGSPVVNTAPTARTTITIASILHTLAIDIML